MFHQLSGRQSLFSRKKHMTTGVCTSKCRGTAKCRNLIFSSGAVYLMVDSYHNDIAYMFTGQSNYLN